MNQLHWVLLSIAAVLLVALYLYGKWQERKSAQVDESQNDLDAARFNVRWPGRTPSARNTRQAPARIEPTIGISVEADSFAGEPPSEESWSLKRRRWAAGSKTRCST